MSITAASIPRQIRTLSMHYQNYQAKEVPISIILDYLGGNSGLTEEAIYQQILGSGDKYDVLSAATEDGATLGKVPPCKIKNRQLKVFENEEGILVSRIGVGSGTTTYLCKGRYAITDNAYILFLRNNGPYKVSLRWIMIQYYEEFFDYRILSEYGVWNVSRFMEHMKIDVPTIEEQTAVVRQYDKLKELKRTVDGLYARLLSIKKKILSEPYSSFVEKDVPISRVLDYVSGNSGLTEEFLYSQVQNKMPKDYRLLTGSTDFTNTVKVGKYRHPKRSDRLITTIDNKPIIHIARKGKAGTCAYFDEGNYTINDDAYLLYVKKEFTNKVKLKWLMYQLRSVFLDYSSAADNGTWNMTGFFENVTLDLPSLNEQDKVVSEYEKLESLYENLNHMKCKIDKLSI